MARAKENEYQPKLIKRIYNEFGKDKTLVLKNDANYRQGIPDLMVLIKDNWFMLEVKRDGKAKRRPNQEWYIDQVNQFGKIIHGYIVFPENEDAVIAAMKKEIGILTSFTNQQARM